jgi:hypothetical protein
MSDIRKSVLSVLLIFIFAFSLSAQSEKKVLTLENYPQWKHILSPAISADGNWVSYSLRPNGGDATLYFKSIASDKIYDIPYGSASKGTVGADPRHPYADEAVFRPLFERKAYAGLDD